jgi:hypothetical protein
MMLLPPRPIAPDVYDATIVEATIVAFEWRANRGNPDGLSLRVAVEIEAEDGPAHVVDAADLTNADRIAAVFASAGLPAPTDVRSAIDTLVGRDVRLTVKNHSPRLGRHAGSIKAAVGSWLRPAVPA